MVFVDSFDPSASQFSSVLTVEPTCLLSWGGADVSVPIGTSDGILSWILELHQLATSLL